MARLRKQGVAMMERDYPLPHGSGGEVLEDRDGEGGLFVKRER